MPDLNDQHCLAIDSLNSLFTGNPKKVLVNVVKEGEEGNLLKFIKSMFVNNYNITTIEGEGGAQAIIEEEGGEEGKIAEALSDKTEEEEVKIPPKNLTGIYLSLI